MVDNSLDYIWSVYFLRESKMVLTGYRSYMNFPWVIRFLKRAYVPPNDEHAFYLSDTPQDHSVWTNGCFYLTRGGSFPKIEKVINPNGLENVNQLPFVWVGNRPTTFMISVPKEDVYLLTAKKIIPGPSIPDNSVRTIRIVDSYGEKLVTVDKDMKFFELRLKKGLNKVEMVCLDTPKVAVLPNRDKRPLLLGIQGYDISKK